MKHDYSEVNPRAFNILIREMRMTVSLIKYWHAGKCNTWREGENRFIILDCIFTWTGNFFVKFITRPAACAGDEYGAGDVMLRRTVIVY